MGIMKSSNKGMFKSSGEPKAEKPSAAKKVKLFAEGGLEGSGTTITDDKGRPYISEINRPKPKPTPTPTPRPTPGKAKGGKFNWIKKAIGKPGALHKALGVPMGTKIPASKLAKAASGSGKVAKEARLAQTLGKMKKK